MLAVILSVLLATGQNPQDVTARDASSLRSALASARPGTRILLAPGDYIGGFHFQDLRGAPGKPIIIASADRLRPARFVGGGNAMQLSRVSHVEIRDLVLTGATCNGINIDDGGEIESPSHHVVLSGLRISDLPRGNHDAVKLSGIEDFRVENCVIERWGGSGIDMVGCHRGIVAGCEFRNGGDNGVQAKGGSSEIFVRSCRFTDAGQRAVNLGGSTGLPFFRPRVDKMPAGARYEARAITVEGCVFVGSLAPIAFVGVDGATVRYNTFYMPERWAIRILQENRAPEFLRCRAGQFSDNLVVFHSDRWASGGVNIGPDTSPETFRFARNLWYCSDRPDQSRPSLPTAETGGAYGQDPLLIEPEKGRFGVRPGSPAERAGAHALPRTRTP